MSQFSCKCLGASFREGMTTEDPSGAKQTSFEFVSCKTVLQALQALSTNSKQVRSAKPSHEKSKTRTCLLQCSSLGRAAACQAVRSKRSNL